MKIGRNDSCPCGSSKKYKKCCLDKKSSSASHMHPTGIDLDIKSILHYISIASETIGADWLMRKIKEEEQRRDKDKLNIDNRKHSYLFRPQSHPLVLWAIETEQWRKSCLDSGKMELNEAVLKFAILGKALKKAKACNGFEKLISRLKLDSGFDSAAFEVEVAESYMARGWIVEFIEEGKKKTPDLKITRDNGSVFWVECKCRDSLSERDKNIQTFWADLESSLLRILGPKKLNFAIFVKALNDPLLAELSGLRDFILDAIENGGVGLFDIATSRIHPVKDSTGKFLVAVTKLTVPDEKIKTKGIGFQSSENFDRLKIFTEGKVDERGDNYFRNPTIIALKNSQPSDKVSGIIHAFKSATGQLPEEGPGVIWIRIPDNMWSDDIDGSFKQAESLIRDELRGANNRRVNAVMLMTRIFHKLAKDGLTGLGYKPLILRIEHVNPRCQA